jgi:hypothetical protein
VLVVPVPAVLADLLRQHLREYGTAPDGRLFGGARGGMLSESVYGRVWHVARDIAFGPELAATTLARRPYDLRHAALSLWLNSTGAPAEVAARAGNSARVLQDVHAHCIDGRDEVISRQIEDALDPESSTRRRSRCVTASGTGPPQKRGSSQTRRQKHWPQDPLPAGHLRADHPAEPRSHARRIPLPAATRQPGSIAGSL